MENKDPKQQTASNDVEDISKIREILFGNNMHEYEKRFDILEEKLAKSIIENKEEMDKKIATIDFFIKKELKVFNERLQEEEETREKYDKKLMAITDDLEIALKKLKSTINDNMSEDREQFKEITSDLGNQILSLKQMLQSQIEQHTNQLQSNKVDRSSLAIMLTDLAYKIAGENEEVNKTE